MVQSRASEVTACRSAIENETLADTEAILHRLRAAEAAKMSVLQADADALATDIGAIDRFYSTLQAYAPQPLAAGSSSAGAAATTAAAGGAGGAPPPPPPSAASGTSGSPYGNPTTALDFMRAYPELCAEADRLSSKPHKLEVSE